MADINTGIELSDVFNLFMYTQLKCWRNECFVARQASLKWVTTLLFLELTRKEGHYTHLFVIPSTDVRQLIPSYGVLCYIMCGQIIMHTQNVLSHVVRHLVECERIYYICVDWQRHIIVTPILSMPNISAKWFLINKYHDASPSTLLCHSVVYMCWLLFLWLLCQVVELFFFALYRTRRILYSTWTAYANTRRLLIRNLISMKQ